MAVYPFYISTEAYGKKTPIEGGTRSKYGDMTTTIYQRDKGAITTPFRIRQYSTQYVDKNTNKEVHHLHTDVYYNGELIASHTTDY